MLKEASVFYGPFSRPLGDCYSSCIDCFSVNSLYMAKRALK